MAEISTEMLVCNLAQGRLNDCSLRVSKVVKEISKVYDKSMSVSKRKYTKLIYEVEDSCQHLEFILENIVNLEE